MRSKPKKGRSPVKKAKEVRLVKKSWQQPLKPEDKTEKKITHSLFWKRALSFILTTAAIIPLWEFVIKKIVTPKSEKDIEKIANESTKSNLLELKSEFVSLRGTLKNIELHVPLINPAKNLKNLDLKSGVKFFELIYSFLNFEIRNKYLQSNDSLKQIWLKANDDIFYLLNVQMARYDYKNTKVEEIFTIYNPGENIEYFKKNYEIEIEKFLQFYSKAWEIVNNEKNAYW